MSSDLGDLFSPPISINYSRSGFTVFTNQKYLRMIFFSSFFTERQIYLLTLMNKMNVPKLGNVFGLKVIKFIYLNFLWSSARKLQKYPDLFLIAILCSKNFWNVSKLVTSDLFEL